MLPQSRYYLTPTRTLTHFMHAAHAMPPAAHNRSQWRASKSNLLAIRKHHIRSKLWGWRSDHDKPSGLSRDSTDSKIELGTRIGCFALACEDGDKKTPAEWCAAVIRGKLAAQLLSFECLDVTQTASQISIMSIITYRIAGSRVCCCHKTSSC
jgi:hypothetical protein